MYIPLATVSSDFVSDFSRKLEDHIQRIRLKERHLGERSNRNPRACAPRTAVPHTLSHAPNKVRQCMRVLEMSVVLLLITVSVCLTFKGALCRCYCEDFRYFECKV